MNCASRRRERKGIVDSMRTPLYCTVLRSTRVLRCRRTWTRRNTKKLNTKNEVSRIMVYPDDDELVLRYLPRSLECWVGRELRESSTRSTQAPFDISTLLVQHRKVRQSAPLSWQKKNASRLEENLYPFLFRLARNWLCRRDDLIAEAK